MTMKEKEKTSCAGRPREFDVDRALEQALEVFWRNGYEGTSLTDLTQAMGINKPSLYSAFGNKEQLFIKAIDLYDRRPGSFYNQAFGETSWHGFITALLYGAAESMTDTCHPQGCALINSFLSCSETNDSLKQALLTRRGDKELMLFERIETARKEGDISGEANPEALTHFLGTVLYGMSAQATKGMTANELRQVAELALQCFLK